MVKLISAFSALFFVGEKSKVDNERSLMHNMTRSNDELFLDLKIIKWASGGARISNLFHIRTQVKLET